MSIRRRFAASQSASATRTTLRITKRMHDQVEGPNDRPGGRQSLGRHQPDGPEVGWQRDAERGLEALGEDVRGIGRSQVGELDIGRDQSHRLQLGQGGAHDREDVERQIAVDDAHDFGFAAQAAARSGRG